MVLSMFSLSRNFFLLLRRSVCLPLRVCIYVGILRESVALCYVHYFLRRVVFSPDNLTIHHSILGFPFLLFCFLAIDIDSRSTVCGFPPKAKLLLHCGFPNISATKCLFKHPHVDSDVSMLFVSNFNYILSISLPTSLSFTDYGCFPLLFYLEIFLLSIFTSSRRSPKSYCIV